MAEETNEQGEPPEEPSPARGLAKLGALGLFLWKFKFALGFLLTKGKFLLLGLTKGKTFLSMGLSILLYLTVWGWKFAVGFVLSIYIHEMGHVAALRRRGIAASAPMFIPFVGAFVRLKDYPKTPVEDAEIGLAGPIYGLGAAAVCYALFKYTDSELIGALARAGAFINLFNLVPVWQLDGSRGFHALDRQKRWIATAAIFGAWFWSGEGLLLLVLVVAGWRAWKTPPEEKPASEYDGYRILATYIGLIFVLAGLAQIHLVGLANASL